MGMTHTRRFAAITVLAAVVCAWVTAMSPAVFAHEVETVDGPAYIAVEPKVEGVQAHPGGLGTVKLTAPGREVEVLGLNGEPYLRLDAEGRAWHNDLSPTYFVHLDNLGAFVAPDQALAYDPTVDAPVWLPERYSGGLLWFDSRLKGEEWSIPVRIDGGDYQLRPSTVDPHPEPNTQRPVLAVVLGVMAVGVALAVASLTIGRRRPRNPATTEEVADQ
jgi:hypothetical protein